MAELGGGIPAVQCGSGMRQVVLGGWEMGGSAVHKWSVHRGSTGSGVQQHEPGQVPPWPSPLHGCEHLVAHMASRCCKAAISAVSDLTGKGHLLILLSLMYLHVCLLRRLKFSEGRTLI